MSLRKPGKVVLLAPLPVTTAALNPSVFFAQGASSR